MKHIFLILFAFLFFLASCNLCSAQYSISGYLDTEEKTKRVYLSLLKYNEQWTIYEEQILTSTLSDSLGYFSFEGQLLSDKHALYRIHSRVNEDQTSNQLADTEAVKNFHNFVFSNRDTIVFKKNPKFWFSNSTNTNPVDKEWQAFSSYANKLNTELFNVSDIDQRNQSSWQVLSELKSYANTKNTHPLVTLVLLSGVEEEILKDDYKNDYTFYTKLQDSLNRYYDNTSYAKQFKELTTDLSKTETQLELDFYRRLVYVLGALCFALCIGIFFLLVKLKQKKKDDTAEVSVNLTNQEERIAQLIFQDKTNKEIASELFISVSTVKTHIRNLYAKLEVTNRQELMDILKNHPRD